MTSEWEITEHQISVIQKVRQEAERENPVKQRCQLVSFISHSAGRGRKRKSREVNLLVVDNTYAFVVENHQVMRRKNKDYIQIDVLANEVLGTLPQDERTVDRLLQILSK